MRLQENAISLEFEPSAKTQLPKRQPGIWHEEDFWRLTGLIEGELKFSSDRVCPMGTRQSFNWKHTRAFQDLDIDRLDVAPAGFDALSRRQKDRLSGSASKVPRYPSVNFNAVLVGCNAAFLNAGTKTEVRNDFLGRGGGGSSHDTFIDRSQDYDFALINRDQDLHVHLRSKYRFQSTGEEEDWIRFQALLTAIGFTHGFQPWPYRVEYWRDGTKLADRLTPPRKLTKTAHAPFDTGIAMNFIGRNGTRNSAVRLASQFFEQHTELSEKLEALLFLFREAGNRSAQFHIRTLALCSLFERTVEVLFDELKLEETVKSRDPHFEKYCRVRDRLTTALRRIARHNDRAVYERLAGCLGHADPIRVKDKYRAICEHFGLNYDSRMKRRFDAWLAERNPRAHGDFTPKDSDYEHQSLIAGTINIFVLKLMRYSGNVKAFAFAPEVQGRYEMV